MDSESASKKTLAFKISCNSMQWKSKKSCEKIEKKVDCAPLSK